MKSWILMAGLCLALTFNFAPALASVAQEPDVSGSVEDGLSRIRYEYREQIETILSEYKGTADMNRQLKDAGASFQKDLIFPVENLSRYKTAIGRAQASGACISDAAYAALFIKKREMVQSLEAAARLNETLGIALPLSQRFKQIIDNPDAIKNYSTWSDAMDEFVDTLIEKGLDSEERLCFVVNYLYGSLIQGMYMVTETIAQSGYTPDMLQLMADQRHKAMLFMQILNVFRGDAILEKAIGFDSRFRLLGQVHNLLLVNRFNRRDVDDIRRLIAPERRAIIAP